MYHFCWYYLAQFEILTFMAQFEKQHIPTSKTNQYYADDISIIHLWYGQELSKELLVFLENLNSKHKTIKFEHNISRSNISFLDTLIYKDKNSTLQTTLYRKPTISNPISMPIQTIQSHL